MDDTTIAAAAFGLNFLVQIIGGVWAVANIKGDLTNKIGEEREETARSFADMREQFLKEQKTQDHNFGEVGAAMRQYIANVEKEMHQIEIWNRDNFVLKSEFTKATDSLREDIKAMAADIKTDIRDLAAKMPSG